MHFYHAEVALQSNRFLPLYPSPCNVPCSIMYTNDGINYMDGFDPRAAAIASRKDQHHLTKRIFNRIDFSHPSLREIFKVLNALPFTERPKTVPYWRGRAFKILYMYSSCFTLTTKNTHYKKTNKSVCNGNNKSNKMPQLFTFTQFTYNYHQQYIQWRSLLEIIFQNTKLPIYVQTYIMHNAWEEMCMYVYASEAPRVAGYSIMRQRREKDPVMSRSFPGWM